jgi:hypothetical protein
VLVIGQDLLSQLHIADSQCSASGVQRARRYRPSPFQVLYSTLIATYLQSLSENQIFLIFRKIFQDSGLWWGSDAKPVERAEIPGQKEGGRKNL